MSIYTKIIGAFILGIILTIFTYQAYTIYQYTSILAADHATLGQVVNYLQSANKTTATQAPAEAKK